jgi:uncharacterized protein (TIGR03435 family)
MRNAHWTANPATRALALAATVAAGSYAQVPAKTASVPVPVYDVATIRPNNSGRGSMQINVNNETLYATNVTLKDMLQFAYGIRPELISQLPGWAVANHYDIVAKISDADPEMLKHLKDEDYRRMLMQLLVVRFRLKSHVEVKQLPTFDLVIAKGGIKFQEMAKDTPEDKQGSAVTSNTEITAYGVPILTMAEMLENQVQRNVMDKTGLHGNYDFHLKWHNEEDGPASGLGDVASPSLFTALQEQLGLKLQSSRGPVDTLVVDHVEAPSEN